MAGFAGFAGVGAGELPPPPLLPEPPPEDDPEEEPEPEPEVLPDALEEPLALAVFAAGGEDSGVKGSRVGPWLW